MEVLIAGAVAAAAMLFLILKFGKLRRILAFDKWIDILVTLGVGIMFFGTFSGMMVAVTAGCIVSAFLYFAKKLVGCDKLTWKGWKPDVEPWEPTMAKYAKWRAKCTSTTLHSS